MKQLKKGLKILTISILSVLVLLYVTIQVMTYRLDSDMIIDITKENFDYILVESDDPKAVLYVYPGGLVEAKAYVPFAMSLSEEGFHMMILKSPIHLLISDPYQAEKYIDMYDNLPRFAVGHSLGGVAASLQILKNQDMFEGVMYLSSYPSVDLSQLSLDVLSIYGTRDGVLNKSAYVTSKDLLPENTQYEVIAGGNHAQFAHYGNQRGDLAPCIDHMTQQRITVEWITTFILNRI